MGLLWSKWVGSSSGSLRVYGHDKPIQLYFVSEITGVDQMISEQYFLF